MFHNSSYTPSLAFLEDYIKVEDVGTSLFRRDRLYIVQLLQGNYFTNAARSRITTRKPETTFTPSCTLKSTHRLKTLVTAAQAAGEEALEDSEDEDECQ